MEKIEGERYKLLSLFSAIVLLFHFLMNISKNTQTNRERKSSTILNQSLV